MKILFLRREMDLQREPLGYVRDLRRLGMESRYLQNDCRLNEDIDLLMDRLAKTIVNNLTRIRFSPVSVGTREG